MAKSKPLSDATALVKTTTLKEAKAIRASRASKEPKAKSTKKRGRAALSDAVKDDRRVRKAAYDAEVRVRSRKEADMIAEMDTMPDDELRYSSNIYRAAVEHFEQLVESNGSVDHAVSFYCRCRLDECTVIFDPKTESKLPLWLRTNLRNVVRCPADEAEQELDPEPDCVTRVF
jgi:hypothetical protein